MTVTLERWRPTYLVGRNGKEEALDVSLPCGHEATIRKSWFDEKGKFSGRLGCTTPGCRRVFDDVVLGEPAK